MVYCGALHPSDVSSHILYYLHSTFIIGKVSNELERYVNKQIENGAFFIFLKICTSYLDFV